MFKRFFHIGIAEGASIVIANVVMSSLQHVSGVESVGQEKPPKDLYFHCKLRLPMPGISLMGSDLPEVKVIIFVGRERLGRPSADPAIIPREAIIQLDIMCDTLKISSLCMRLN